MILSGKVKIVSDSWDETIRIGNEDLIYVLREYARSDGGGTDIVDESKTLGNVITVIPNCSMYAYFTDEECTLDEAKESLIDEIYGTCLCTAHYTGYSEWTIIGLKVDSLTLGGHDLVKEFKSHEGEYVHLLINE